MCDVKSEPGAWQRGGFREIAFELGKFARIFLVAQRCSPCRSTPENRGRDRAGRNRVYAYSKRPEFDSRNTSVVTDSCFRSSVQNAPLTITVSSDTRIIDDRSALLRFHHSRRMFDSEYDTTEQETHRKGELFFGRIVQLSRRRCARVVEHTVEASELLNGEIDNFG